MDRYKIRAADIITAVLIIIISLLPIFLSASRGVNAKKTAVIYKNNKIEQRLYLDKDVEFYVGSVLVQVKGGKVRIKDSDCPFKICMHAGWISAPGSTLICLPNRTMIRIEGEGGEYDAISY